MRFMTSRMFGSARLSGVNAARRTDPSTSAAATQYVRLNFASNAVSGSS
jgi:hypothetical protein